MKKIITYLIYLFVLSSPMNLWSQCPSVKYILVDACNGAGTEPNNEYFIINSGDGFNVNDLGFTITNGTVTATSSNNTDFNATNPCASCIAGCTVNFVTNGGSVPSGQNVVVFTSNQLNFVAYDFSNFCVGGQIYVLVANAAPGTGQFANYSTSGGGACSGCTDPSGLGNRTITLTEVGGCTGAYTYNKCSLIKVNGTCGAEDGGAVVFNGTVAGYNNTGCTAPSQVLPIELIQFEAHVQGRTTLLEWSTETETDNALFTIERSSNGRDFFNIGEIKGANNSHTLKQYSFVDEAPQANANYYRLKQTDYNGTFSFSPIRVVKHLFGSNLQVAPLVTNDQITVFTDFERYDVSIYALSGVELQSQNDLSGSRSISMESLEAGVYLVKIHDGHEVQVVRVLKI